MKAAILVVSSLQLLLKMSEHGKNAIREDDYMQFLMTRNKETRKYFGHVKVLNDQYEIIGWRATGFEDLKIYDNIYN